MSQEDLGLDARAVTEVVEPAGRSFRDVVAVMLKLRAPDGCPWDREQTHQTLARHLLEETYEVLEAIDAADLDALREELGDLLLQVLFHAEIAWEEGAFTVAEVCDELRAKLVRRHPHVFGDVAVGGADEVLANWERMKRAEKGSAVLEGIPRALPALARAAKVSRRAAQVGFDLADRMGDVEDELGELRAEIASGERARMEAELGDVLFAVAALARSIDVDPEAALRRSVDVFAERFAAVESMTSDDHRELESLSAEDWAGYWERAKQER